jgi:hypothetical protein
VLDVSSSFGSQSTQDLLVLGSSNWAAKFSHSATVCGPVEGAKECIVPGARLGPPPAVPGAGVEALGAASAGAFDGPACEAAVDALRGRPIRAAGGPGAAMLGKAGELKPNGEFAI